MLLWGPDFKEGPAFSKAFGVFENYTVAGGIPKGSLVYRDGITIHTAASALLAAISRDCDLLGYDYSYKLADQPKRYGGGQGISVGGRSGRLSLRPKGYCYIQLLGESRNAILILETIDLRSMGTIATDHGTLRIFKRRAEIHWLKILPPLLDFLATRLDRVLSLDHIDRVG